MDVRMSHREINNSFVAVIFLALIKSSLFDEITD